MTSPLDMVAAQDPTRLAAVCASTGQRLTYGDLSARSIRVARMLRNAGLHAGDRIAILLENTVDYYVIAWAARRAELRYVPINWHLGAAEVRYLIENCDARAIVSSPTLAALAQEAASAAPRDALRLSIREAFGAYGAIDAAIAHEPAIAPADERDGNFMFYSSGTTGHPKGILRALTGDPFGARRALEDLAQNLFGYREGMIYFNPAPLYHAAPLGWSMTAQAYGGTAVIAEKFDAAGTLDAIARFGVTHAHFVPTHFVRLLKLPAEVRAAADLRTLEVVIHAAAPCPIPVKAAMIEWMGPIVYEFYSGSEGGGFTTLTSQEWLAHQGSVGRSIGAPIRIVGEDGAVLGVGEIGAVYFENAERFTYHKDDAKTAAFFNDEGWGTLGDIGHLDADGYLYLSDRRSHMIISGGVNIYPQEVEDLLIAYPGVADAAVIGVPDEDMGEQVKAVIVVEPGVRADAALAATLIAHCRTQLAAYKCPRSVDFVDALPRLPTGKLLKRELRKQYWDAASQT